MIGANQTAVGMLVGFADILIHSQTSHTNRTALLDRIATVDKQLGLTGHHHHNDAVPLSKSSIESAWDEANWSVGGLAAETDTHVTDRPTIYCVENDAGLQVRAIYVPKSVVVLGSPRNG